MRRLIGVILFLFISATVWAGAPCAPTEAQWFPRKTTLVTDKAELLLVTHASTEFAGGKQTIDAVQESIRKLKGRAEVVYLHRGGFEKYMYPSCDPDWFYHSEGGEVRLDLEATNSIYAVGGYYSYCLDDTTSSISKAIARLKTPKNLRLTYVMDATFESMGGLQAQRGIDGTLASALQPRVGLSFNYAWMAEQGAAYGLEAAQLAAMFDSAFNNQPFPDRYEVQGHLRNHYGFAGGDWIDWNIKPAAPGKGAKAFRLDIYYLEARDL